MLGKSLLLKEKFSIWIRKGKKIKTSSEFSENSEKAISFTKKIKKTQTQLPFSKYKTKHENTVQSELPLKANDSGSEIQPPSLNSAVFEFSLDHQILQLISHIFRC